MEMDLSRAFSVGVDYKDRRSRPSWETRSFVEIVFVDKTNPSVNAHLYQLKEDTLTLDDIEQWKRDPAFFPKEAFVFIGEISAIDKKKKQILLTNKVTIGYNYLIVASGTKSSYSIRDEEFAAGLQALMEAIRVKPKIPDSFAKYTVSHYKSLEKTNPTEVTRQAPSDDNVDIEKIAHPHLSPNASRYDNPVELTSINKRLFEVQL